MNLNFLELFKKRYGRKKDYKVIKVNGSERCEFSGNYKNWDEALHDCDGYQKGIILDKTCDALLKVKSGEVAYERDSVTFDKIKYPFELISLILKIALECDLRNINILDFGGSLGSTYFTVRKFIPKEIKLTWMVVEQESHVICGKKHFECDELKFYYSLDECLKRGPNLILFCSVLQYIRNPYQVFRKALISSSKYIYLDRTYFGKDPYDRIIKQNVPEWIYPASYPCWLFETIQKFTDGENVKVISEFDCLDTISIDSSIFPSKGYILKCK